MVRIDATADDSLAAMRARSRLGMAIAAIIRMIATTMSNSISENPFCFLIILRMPQDRNCEFRNGIVKTVACFVPNREVPIWNRDPRIWMFSVHPRFSTRGHVQEGKRGVDHVIKKIKEHR